MIRLNWLTYPCLTVVLLGAALGLHGDTGAEDIRLTVGKSIVIDYPADIRQISFSNPDVVDATAVTTREILIHGKAFGTVTLIVWSRAGQRSFYSIIVEQNLDPLRKLLKDTFPAETIQVQSSRDSLSLTGRVSLPSVAERATALAASFAKSVVNNMQVAPGAIEKQILLRVKFAELNRNTTTELGVNFVSTGAANTPGRITTGQFAPPSPGSLNGTIPGTSAGTTSTFSISDALNIFAFRPDLNLAALIRALQSKGVLQILAEPNLVTTNGKEAHFLVGGEFPIPILQGGANAGAVTIQFKEFGVRLSFTPVITENHTIKMYVKPEVATIDIANSVNFNGFTIPALSTRRVETNIELSEGQSFVLGGLIDDRETEIFSKIPGLANLPVFGALFKSKRENRSKTELVVIVTPEITQPLQPGEPQPLPIMPNEFLAPIHPSETAKAASLKSKLSRKSGRKNVKEASASSVDGKQAN